METINCPICDSNKFKNFIEVSDRLDFRNNKIFNIVKCECDFLYLNPRPTIEEISKYYKNSNYDPHKKNKKTFKDILYRFVQKLAISIKSNRIKKHISSGNLLDIGGGMGEFSEYMNNNGFSVTLQDNHSNYSGNLEFYNDIFKINSKFNIITMWHVLEHIHDLKQLFKFVNNKLEKNGVFVLAVPNHNAVERNFYKKNWAPYDAPRHLYHFDEFSLSKILKLNNFKIVNSYSLIQDSFYNILLSIKNYNLINIIKSIHISMLCVYKTILGGAFSSSSIMIICKKK